MLPLPEDQPGSQEIGGARQVVRGRSEPSLEVGVG